MPIFTACYAYTKKWINISGYENNFYDNLNVSLIGINDMKIILYKDA